MDTLSLLNEEQFLKKRICFHMNKFFPVRVDLNLERFVIQGSKQEVTKAASLCTNVGNPLALQRNYEIYVLFEKLEKNCLLQ